MKNRLHKFWKDYGEIASGLFVAAIIFVLSPWLPWLFILGGFVVLIYMIGRVLYATTKGVYKFFNSQ